MGILFRIPASRQMELWALRCATALAAFAAIVSGLLIYLPFLGKRENTYAAPKNSCPKEL